MNTESEHGSIDRLRLFASLPVLAFDLEGLESGVHLAELGVLRLGLLVENRLGYAADFEGVLHVVLPAQGVGHAGLRPAIGSCRRHAFSAELDWFRSCGSIAVASRSLRILRLTARLEK